MNRNFINVLVHTGVHTQAHRPASVCLTDKWGKEIKWKQLHMAGCGVRYFRCQNYQIYLKGFLINAEKSKLK